MHGYMKSQALLVAAAILALSLPGHGRDGHQQTLTRDGRELLVTISPGFDQAQRRQLTTWVTFITGALASVYGKWPRQRWEISISPAAASDADPIPWAQVNRGELDHVEFFIAPRVTATALKQAWTGYHELAHLLIPYQGWGETWFSEGLASYYQNILQARSGVLTEQQAWQNLYDGFLRGRNDTQFDGQPLSSVSRSMREQGGFMRVYWSGAWYFLAVDVQLRRQSGGQLTLDLALQKLNDCCADQQLSVEQMVGKLDQLNEVVLFQLLFDEVKASERMPDFEPILSSLGVTANNGVIDLQQEGPGARLRGQVTRLKPL